MKQSKKEAAEKGLTLAELLIVIAIIGVLTSVSIPIFNRQLEKARETYDIHTMRQAASAAIELYYAGIMNEASAAAAGLKWNQGDRERSNAYGIYVPGSGRFLPMSSRDSTVMAYGKGTKIDGGTRYVLGNERGAYAATADYTKAFVMIAIYPLAKVPHADIYWKGRDGKYIGDQNAPDDPKYSIRILLR